MRLGAKREASEAVATATCSRLGRTGVGWDGSIKCYRTRLVNQTMTSRAVHLQLIRLNLKTAISNISNSR